MDPRLSEWLNLALRWFHVVAGVFWIGQTALFSWLDTRLRVETEGAEARIWMVHSGGFYRVDRIGAPRELPHTLHWFKWEAALTWLSGFFLFALVYYYGGALLAAESPVGAWAATGISLGLLIAGWVVYDLLWVSRLARREGATVALCFLLAAATAWGLTRLFSGRGAYLQIGAMLGTIMAANVWMRILPAQRRMVAAAAAGRPFDPTLAFAAKQRSKHNTFLAIPVIFIMISTHYPVATYGHRWSWAILAALVLVGWGARKLVDLRNAA